MAVAGQYGRAEDEDPSGQCDEDGVNTSLRALQRRNSLGCTASDPDSGVDDGGEDGDEREARNYYPLPPRYDDDQTKGPINQVEIARDHHRRLHTEPTYCP